MVVTQDALTRLSTWQRPLLLQACEGDQLRQLVHSLCPTIFGHELVKAGLVLALFGGVRKVANTPDRVPTRGDIHVLIVGDPGLGKSQLLQVSMAAVGQCPMRTWCWQQQCAV